MNMSVGRPMQVIAESAFNHQGDLDYLLGMAQAASKAGADLFTVQVYRTSAFCTPDYSRQAICAQVELSQKEWDRVFAHCADIGLMLVPCPLDLPSLEYVLSKGIQLLKIHATDLLNIPYLRNVHEAGVRVLLETQCATKRDIQTAMDIIGSQVEAIFHGFSNYPTDYADCNINALDDIRRTWGTKTGFADHTLDTVAMPIACLAKGVDYLEKHITLGREHRHYDWQVSLEPAEFRSMMASLAQFSKALGSGRKHPVPQELTYRSVLHKKYVERSDGQVDVIRSDAGDDYHTHRFRAWPRDRVVAAVVARLKSRRLERKVLKPLMDKPMVVALLDRVAQSSRISKVVLATSDLPEDVELVEVARNAGHVTFTGDAISVIDRLLDLAEREQAAAVFRITGDNPFTDPALMDRMVGLYLEHDLDYVRCDGFPFGVAAELFSTSYLMRLYQRSDPQTSEYLTWFVILDDTARKGHVVLQGAPPELARVGLSVDHQADYERVTSLLDRIGKRDFTSVSLREVLTLADTADLIGWDGMLKLPGGTSITFMEYLERLRGMAYVVTEQVHGDSIY
jgi:N,N'-diacetyllegionaminate synthase